MATVKDRIVDEALSLPADARLDLVGKLLNSLNLPLDEELDRLWAQEAERRVAQIDAGAAETIPGDEVFSRIQAKRGK